MSLPIIQTIQNNINNLKIVKNDIKNAVNTDYNFITNEQIESYPDLIKQSIAYYKNRIPHAIKEGTNLNFNAAPLKFDNMTIKGNTEQEQLSGKNLYGINDYEGTFKSVEIKIKDGEIMLNGTADSNGTLYIEPKNTQILNGTYMITNTFISGTQTGGGNINLRNVSDNTVIDGTQLSFGDSVRKITLNNKNIKYGIYLASGATFNSFKIKPQIVTGDVPDYDYEPYCGGQASPNPDYPQEIKVVTGDNVVKHVGKNLLNIADGTYANNGVTAVVENGKITLNGTPINGTSFIRIPFHYEYNGLTYSLSANNNEVLGGKTGSENCATLRIDGQATTQAVLGNKNAIVTFVLDNTYNNITIRTGYRLAYNNFVIYPQLEIGQPTSYEPYRGEEYELSLGNMELCKIGGYQDILFKNVVGDENYNAELENEAWYKKKAIDKKVLDGEMSFDKSGVTNVFYTSVITNYSRINNKPFCDNFKGFNNVKNAHSVNIINGVGFNNLYNYNRLYISFNGTIDEFKDFLNEKMPTLYYANDNPTYEKITDPTLISQLEVLSKAKGNDGTTIITTNGEGLDPVLNFIAYLKEV